MCRADTSTRNEITYCYLRIVPGSSLCYLPLASGGSRFLFRAARLSRFLRYARKNAKRSSGRRPAFLFFGAAIKSKNQDTLRSPARKGRRGAGEGCVSPRVPRLSLRGNYRASRQGSEEGCSAGVRDDERSPREIAARRRFRARINVERNYSTCTSELLVSVSPPAPLFPRYPRSAARNRIPHVRLRFFLHESSPRIEKIRAARRAGSRQLIALENSRDLSFRGTSWNFTSSSLTMSRGAK